jgi:hypothetical protein
MSDIESCGGCPQARARNGSLVATDCSALPNVDSVACVDGACAIGTHCSNMLIMSVQSPDLRLSSQFHVVDFVQQNPASKTLPIMPEITPVFRTNDAAWTEPYLNLCEGL